MKGEKSRRNVLKVVGSGVGSVALTGQTMGAEDTNRKTEYVGFKYNPRNQEITSNINGRLSRSERSLAGTIDLGNYRIPVSATTDRVRFIKEMDNPADFDERLSTFKLVKGGKLASNGRNMKLDISSITNGGVTGLLRHSIDQPKEAFMLKPVNGKKTKSQIVNEMKAEFRGE